MIAAGIVLLLVAVAGFAVEAHKPGLSVPGIVGLAALIGGGLLLIDAGTFKEVSRPLLIVSVVGYALFLIVAVRVGVATRNIPPPVTSVIGEDGVATSDLDPVGTVRVRSEQWSAESTAGTIEAGAKIHVVDHQGLRLRVERGG